MRVMNKSKMLLKGFGFLLYKSISGGEIINSISLVINYKQVLMIAVCEKYWYEGDVENKINFRFKDGELIIGRLAIKI